MFLKLTLILISILQFCEMSQIDLCHINMTKHTLYPSEGPDGIPVGTETTETLSGRFKCNGNVLKEIYRDAVYTTRTPCTGITTLVGNDSYIISCGAPDHKELMVLYSPQTFSAYINGNQLFVQFGDIRSGRCNGGTFMTVQLLKTHKSGNNCLPPFGLQMAESLFAYIRIQGGECDADCHGTLRIKFNPSIQANYV